MMTRDEFKTELVRLRVQTLERQYECRNTNRALFDRLKAVNLQLKIWHEELDKGLI